MTEAPLPDIPSAPPTTTHEQDRHSAGQRAINRVWEYTQSYLAVAVITCVLVVDSVIAVYGQSTTEISSAALMQINVIAGIVIGFYFGRTNHQRVGGVDLGR